MDYFKFQHIDPKYITPCQVEKNVFPVRGKMGIFFWVFRTLSGLVLFKNSIVISVVQVPCSFYWTIKCKLNEVFSMNGSQDMTIFVTKFVYFLHEMLSAAKSPLLECCAYRKLERNKSKIKYCYLL